MSAREEWEFLLNDEGRRAIEAFMAEGCVEDDDFDPDEVIARNHADAMRDWFGKNGLPARGELR